MIVHDVLQGSDAWLQLRLGRPTGSGLSRIVTEKTRKLSAQSGKYVAQLAAEWALGTPLDDAGSAFMTRGTQLENEARNWYAFTRDVEVQQVGFITNDAETVGCSPDGIIAPDGMIEIKCYEARHHVEELLNTDLDAHRAQIQGSLWIAERQWCDRIFFNPTLPSLVVRLERDDEYIEALASAMDDFLERLEESKRRLIELGFNPTSPCQCMTENGVCGSREGVADVDGIWLCERCAAAMAQVFGG